MDAAVSPPASDFAFNLSVSCEPAFADTVRALTARAAALAGCSAECSTHVGDCVGGLFTALISGGVTHATDVDLDVRGSSRLITVDVRCPESCTPALVDALGRSGTEPALRAMVDRLECGESRGRSYCRVTQQVQA